MAYIDRVNKKDIQEMPWNEALQLLIKGTKAHLTGAGCGSGHQVPTGIERQRYLIAMAKIHYKL